jgi:phosphoglycerate dehydrogenase-like enzyme
MTICPKAAFVMAAESFPKIYNHDLQKQIGDLVDIVGGCFTPSQALAASQQLCDVEILLSGWGGPKLDHRFLNVMPQLKAVFYGAGTTSGIVTDAAWERGIVVTSAYAANAVPVAEYCFATTIFSLKRGWEYMRSVVKDRTFHQRLKTRGAYESVVGLVSMGMTARKFRELLQMTDLRVIAYDPYLSPQEAEELGVVPAALPELFALSDVVSIHTPLLPETVGLISARELNLMRPGATLINTARGRIINQTDLIDVLHKRPDIIAVLDVTDPEPPPPESPLYDLPNVVLTPHIAGSLDDECARMGRDMVAELGRYLGGQPLRWAVTPELAARTSHRPADASSRIKLIGTAG